MARLTWNGTTYDTHIGTTDILGTTTTQTPSGIFSAPFTAPNTSNKVTGVWIFYSTLPSSATTTVTLQESTVDTACSTTILAADTNYGWNYVRFPTPYQFTTTSANAYRFKVTNPSTQGQLRLSSSLFAYSATYDTGVAIGATDDIWHAGWHAGGLTPKTLNLSGTSNSWGSGTDKSMTTATIQSVGAALFVGNGGTVKYDTTASTTLTIRGSILVYRGGLFDMRANSSNKAIVSRLVFDNETNDNDYGLISAAGNFGGQILTTGATYDVYTTYASGLGTAASPLIVSTGWDADVNDEIVILGGTDYSKHELRYIKTRNSSTSFVLSSTPGGAEAALTNTHAAGAHICNMQRNSIITALTTTRGWWFANAATLPPAPAQDISWTRMEYSSAASGAGINTYLGTTSLDNTCTYDGLVVYRNSAPNRSGIVAGQNTQTQTINGVIVYDPQSTNGAGSGGLGLTSCSNKTYTNCFFMNGANSTASGPLLAISSGATNNTFNNCHLYGGNSNNNASNSALYVASPGNTFNNCTINGSRVRGALFAGATGTNFNNCNFGNQSTNTIDIGVSTSTLNTVLFNANTFGSATLISNYLNQLEGSDIAFQDMDGNTSKHRWYTNRGSFWSSGSGLTETTVRTASSLGLAIKPENSTLGAEMFFKIPANPASNVQIYGYIYRNATFSSGDITVDLFLPGTLLTDTPDDTVTLSTTTGAWQLWALNAYNDGTVARYATVRIRAKTATAGAYAFLDDIYDAQTNNKVAGLDLWDAGHISPIMLALDLSALPEQTRVAVWSDSSTYDPGTKGQQLIDAYENTEITQAKVDQL